MKMEEEREKRRQWWKEHRKLSSEEKKKWSEEYDKRRLKKYLALSPEVLLAEAQVHATLDSILAGLMFTASVLFFTVGKDLPNGEIMAFLTLLDTFFFVASALLLDFHSSHARRGEMWAALHYGIIAAKFGWIGGLLMTANLVIMTFFLRWEFGIMMLIVVVLSWAYVFYTMFRDVLTFRFWD